MQFKPYTKQPLTIQAFQYTGNIDHLPSEFKSLPNAIITDRSLSILTLEGSMRVDVGDYVIRGIKGEYYPCKPDIFTQSYVEAITVPNYLPAHMQRVYVELVELEKKIIALIRYQAKGYPGASELEKDLLASQVKFMDTYAATLGERLAQYASSQETKVNLIYAKSINGVIGQDGKLPWNIREDLKHFKDVTIGHTVIMGSKTFESMDCKPLKYRTIIVVTSRPDDYANMGVLRAASLLEAIEVCKKYWEKEVFIVGGKRLLEEGLQYADKVYETVVELELPIVDKSVVVDINLKTDERFCVSNMNSFSDWGFILTWDRVK